ncbi:hypothetical protein F5141DRAFT_1014148, partial [Pisolithus sp. B1]
LSTYALDEHEWVVLGQLCDVMKVNPQGTLFFSCGTPNLVMVIPAMDYIDEVFMTGMLDEQWFDPSICAAVRLAKKTLNKYYSLMDTSDLYHITMGTSTAFNAMILTNYFSSPSHHKLEYFRHAKWEADWIKTVSDLVHNTYETSYASHEVHESPASASAADVSENKVCFNYTMAL